MYKCGSLARHPGPPGSQLVLRISEIATVMWIMVRAWIRWWSPGPRFYELEIAATLSVGAAPTTCGVPRLDSDAGSREKLFDAIQEALDCSRTYITRWKSRSCEVDWAGLYPRYRGRKGDCAHGQRWRRGSWRRPSASLTIGSDPLEHTTPRREAGCGYMVDASDVGTGWYQAPSHQALRALERSRLREGKPPT